MKLRNFIKLVESKGATLKVYDEISDSKLTITDSLADSNPVEISYILGEL